MKLASSIAPLLISTVQSKILTPPVSSFITKLAELLHTSHVGQVQPLGLGEWCLIVRLEKRILAQLDDSMRQRLLQEQFDAWLQEQTQQLCDRDKVWLGIVHDQAIIKTAA